jgi:uncharacterized protein (TIGR03086 family)
MTYMTPARDIRTLDQRAVRASVDIASAITHRDLARPTPCAGWTLADLLAHMTAQHRGFTAAAIGWGGDPARWALSPATSTTPVYDYATAADAVLVAFAADDVLRRGFTLAELSSTAAFPAPIAIGFHFIDYLVHTWDVAASLGRRWEPDADLLEPALAITLAVPNGPERSGPGAAFAPGTDPDPEAAAFDRILRLLGRDPAWSTARVTTQPGAL